MGRSWQIFCWTIGAWNRNPTVSAWLALSGLCNVSDLALFFAFGKWSAVLDCFTYLPIMGTLLRGTELVLKTWLVLKYFEKGTLSFLPDLKRTILPWDFFPQTFVFALLQKKRFAHPIWTMRSAYLHSPVLCGQDNSITKDEGKYKIFKKCRSHNTPNEVT